MEPAPSLFLKVLPHSALSTESPQQTKIFFTGLWKAALAKQGNSLCRMHLGTWPEAPVMQEMGTGNIFLAQIQEYWSALLWKSGSLLCLWDKAGERLGCLGPEVLLVPWEVLTSSVFTAWWTQGAAGERETRSGSKRIRQIPPWAPEAAPQSSENIWALLHLISLTPPKQVPLSPS